MNPFATRITANSWLLPLSGMTLLLGLLFSLAWVTNDVRSTRIARADPDLQSRLRGGTLDLQEEQQKLLIEVKKLRSENTRLQNAMAKETDQAKVLNESLQDNKSVAGLTEVEGPGVVVTLRDSPTDLGSVPTEALIVHDIDVLRIVNELWNSGAEAIAINGKRVVTGTSVRCVGSVILVDSAKLAPPVVIRAIGDPQTILGAMNLPGGVVQEIRKTDERMVEISARQYLRLPAFAGPTTKQFAKIPKDTK